MKTNTIVKAKYEDKFVRIHNNIARNPNLSLKAKGLLLVIMSLPDDWVLHISQLPDFCEESKTSVRTAFKELINKGFVLKVEMRDENTGRFKGNNYIAYAESQNTPELMIKNPQDPINRASEPHTDFPHAVNPNVDTPHVDSGTLQRKNATLSTKKKNNKEKQHKASQEFFSLDECIFLLQNGGTLSRERVTDRTYETLRKWYSCKVDSKGYITSNDVQLA